MFHLVRLVLVLMILAVSSSSSSSSSSGSSGGAGNSRDVSTYANIDEIRTNHIHLDLFVNFDKKRLEGSVTHTMEVVDDNVSEIFFDVVGIDIHTIEMIVQDEEEENAEQEENNNNNNDKEEKEKVENEIEKDDNGNHDHDNDVLHPIIHDNNNNNNNDIDNDNDNDNAKNENHYEEKNEQKSVTTTAAAVATTTATTTTTTTTTTSTSNGRRRRRRLLSLEWTISTIWPAIGNGIRIELPRLYQRNETVTIHIQYHTNEHQTATSWMTKEQTACHTMNYVYTQCQDILCRSIAPMQDTPANRITYTADITVESIYDVRMSANRTAVLINKKVKPRSNTNTNNMTMTTVGTSHHHHENDHDNHSFSTTTTYQFMNSVPIPSYLIALAVGDLAYRSLGYRTGIITEPCQLDAVAWELEQLPQFLDDAEQYLTPYIWGNYTLLILPPSFPFGGMENPLLTFASPTIITGDRSQIYVSIHEIAHSWTGNQVTCENWSHFWLNEGFTVFEERKVSSKLHGGRDDFSKVNAYSGNLSSYHDMIQFGLQNNFSSLYPQFDRNQSPDNSFSTIPYEKGFQLLYYLESLIGKDLMQRLIRHYIHQNSLSSINYHTIQNEFEQLVRDQFDHPNEILSKMNWTAWIYEPGLAPVWQDFTTKELNSSIHLAKEYIHFAGQQSPTNFHRYIHYFSNLKVIFLQTLHTQLQEITLPILQRIDNDLNITHTLDPECKYIWYSMAIRKGYVPALEPAHAFISSQGRMKYIIPIYQSLLDSNQTQIAIQWYKENINFYHPVALSKIANMLGIDTKPQPQPQGHKAIAEYRK